MTAFFTFPIIVGIFILGKELIIYIFDPKYLESLNILFIVASFSALNYFLDPIGLVLKSKEKVQYLFYSKIFAIYNLVLDLLVIEPYGIMGVAVVTGSAVLFKNIFLYYFAKKFAPITIEYKKVGAIILNSLCMGVFLFIFRGMISSIVSFVAVFLGGLVVYLLASYFNKVFSTEERDVMNKVLPKPLWVF
jgi:O-antigen/teichoic acid export membrane protein